VGKPVGQALKNAAESKFNHAERASAPSIMSMVFCTP
jgi:hypothetical protein